MIFFLGYEFKLLINNMEIIYIILTDVKSNIWLQIIIGIQL